MDDYIKPVQYIQWNIVWTEEIVILSFAVSLVEAEDILLSKRSQAQKDKHCVFLLIGRS